MRLLPLSSALNFFKNKENFVRTQFARSSYKELLALRTAKQECSDCYLVASIDALTRSSNGREHLKNNIKTAKESVPFYHFTELPTSVKRRYKDCIEENDIFEVTFKDVYNKAETFLIDTKTFNKNFNIYIKQKKTKTTVLSAIEIAMKKLVNRHFFKKPLLSRMYRPFMYKDFEFIPPSDFMRMFIGKEPIVLGEKNINWNLKPYKKEALELFTRMGKNKNNEFSFVAGTGFQKVGLAKPWHCFVIKKVDLKHKMIHLVDKRTNSVTKLSFDDAVKKLKYIAGYFNEDLK